MMVKGFDSDRIRKQCSLFFSSYPWLEELDIIMSWLQSWLMIHLWSYSLHYSLSGFLSQIPTFSVHQNHPRLTRLIDLNLHITWVQVKMQSTVFESVPWELTLLISIGSFISAETVKLSTLLVTRRTVAKGKFSLRIILIISLRINQIINKWFFER